MLIEPVFSEEEWKRVEKLIELILKWNSVIGITSIRDRRGILEELIIDSVAPLSFLQLSPPVMDAGCGAGFPTLPIKIKCPELPIFSVDSNRKKINFLKMAVRELSLKRVYPVRRRVEEMKALKGVMGTVLSKAFAKPWEAVDLLTYFLKPEGVLIIYSVEKDFDRTKIVAEKMGFEIRKFAYTLPFSGRERALFVVGKGR